MSDTLKETVRDHLREMVDKLLEHPECKWHQHSAQVDSKHRVMTITVYSQLPAAGFTGAAAPVPIALTINGRYEITPDTPDLECLQS